MSDDTMPGVSDQPTAAGSASPVHSRRWVLGTAMAAVGAIAVPLPAAASVRRPARWRASWAAPQLAPTDFFDPLALQGFSDTTVRHVVRLSAGGQPRVRFASTFGTRPVVIGSATVARRAAGPVPSAAVDPASVMPITFAGARSAKLAPGESVTSDSLPLRVADGGDLVVSFHLPGPTGPVSLRRYGGATGYLSEPGDHTADAEPTAFTTTTQSFLLVTGVDVRRSAPGPSIAVLGDSITEGFGLPSDTNERWTDVLARRLARGGRYPAVTNLGLSANKLLVDSPLFGQSALTRFDRDVLDLPGVRTVVLAIGTNDLFMQPHQLDTDKILAGLGQLARRSHHRGLRVIGATLTPAGGWDAPPEVEAARQTVNRRIRTSGAFDAVAGFDAALRDPARRDRLRAEFDSGDGIHPNTAGAAALAARVTRSMVWPYAATS